MALDSESIIDVPSRLERIFLHFFDMHFLQDKGSVVDTAMFQREMRLATRLAVASADLVLIPAASYFESLRCRQLLSELDELVQLGFIHLVGSSTNLDEFARERQNESFYRRGSHQHSSYRAEINAVTAPAYQRRLNSTTRDIVSGWEAKVQGELIQRLLRDATDTPLPNLDTKLENLPAELGGLAFIPEHVYEILDIPESSRLVQARIRSVINEMYFGSYLRELNAGVVEDLSYLASDFKVPSAGRNLSYSRMMRFLMSERKVKFLSECSQDQLIALGNEPSWRQALELSVTHVQSISRSTRGISVTSDVGAASSSVRTRSILCIAAATVEFKTAKKIMDTKFGAGDIRALDNDMYSVVYADSNSDSSWYLASMPFQAQLEAATIVAKLVATLKPDFVLMVGMCMGMPKRAYRIGTVVVPNEVFSLDHTRLTTEGTVYRPHAERVTNGLYSLARILGVNADYEVVTDKGLACASTKIENSNAGLIPYIESSLPDVAAFDMEGGAFYRALEGKNCLWIKGVADSGEPQLETKSGQDGKLATQEDATTNAVDFAIKIMQQHALSLQG